MNLETIDYFPDIFEVTFNSIRKTYGEYLNMKISDSLRNDIENDFQTAIQNFNILMNSGSLNGIQNFFVGQEDLLLMRHVDILGDTM